MLLEGLISGALGLIGRSLPEVLKFADRKAERKHELELQQWQYEFTKLQGGQKLQITDLQVGADQVTAALDAVKEAYRSQNVGIRWVDALSATVRPVVTYLVVALWSMVKMATYAQLMANGLTWDVAITTMWGGEDVALMSFIINFWFLGRVFDRALR